MTEVGDTQFGPYELLGRLGAGGMGEVLRARDPRLGREVAIKILRRDVATNPEGVRRFEQEARAAGALNHPNVLAVFDVGERDGLPFVVTELLEGETLRARLERGPLPPRKVLEISVQIARGLSAAHEKGIVHRDLKPENVFLTNDGRTKILDFGLAKLIEPRMPAPWLSTPADTPQGTEPGVVLGTAEYMSPEQARGEPADARADLFALGSLMYEMLTGRRAFDGPTRIAVLYGILHAEPPELAAQADSLPAALDAILRHCLEKRPEDRFQSARDLAFQLEFLTTGSLTSHARLRRLQPDPKLTLRRRLLVLLLAGTLLAGAALGALFAAKLSRRAPPRFRQVSFRRGSIRSARFAPDRTIVYAGAFDSQPMQPYVASADGVDLRPLGFSPADVYAVSPAGEVALGLRAEAGQSSYVRKGVLATVPLAGGSPRELIDDVQFADYVGDELAVVRQVGTSYRLELPPGNVLAETRGWFSHVRASPRGDVLAYIDHSLYGDDRGAIAVVGRTGKPRRLTAEYASIQGLAFRGSEVWFTASEDTGHVLRAARLDGGERVVLASPAALRLYDIAPDGSVLLGRVSARAGLVGRDFEGDERDLSWLDYTIATALSPAAGLFSFFEAGEGGGALGSAYVRRLDGSPAIRLGPGYAWDLSADGRTIAQFNPAEPRVVRLVPTGVGEARSFELPLERVTGARFLPSDGRLIVSGNLKNHGAQLFVADGASTRPFTPEGMTSVFYTVAPVSPDGRRVLGQNASGAYAAWSIDGAAPPVPLPLDGSERPQGWAGPQAIYVHRPRELPQRIERLDLATLRRDTVVEFTPADRAGIEQIGPVFLGPGGHVVLYGYVRNLDELYVAQGLH